MKVLLSLAVLLLFASQLSASPITKHERIEISPTQSFPVLSENISPLIPEDTKTDPRFLPHCNWVSVDGESCVSLGVFSVPPPVSATPEPSSLLLFGMSIIGVLGVTKFRG
jgi:hypothetical protein